MLHGNRKRFLRSLVNFMGSLAISLLQIHHDIRIRVQVTPHALIGGSVHEGTLLLGGLGSLIFALFFEGRHLAQRHRLLFRILVLLFLLIFLFELFQMIHIVVKTKAEKPLLPALRQIEANFLI